MSIKEIMTKRENYQTVNEISTPIYIVEQELEDVLDNMDEAFAEMEDLIVATNLIEMEDAYYDAEGFMDSLKNAAKTFIDQVKSAIDKVITMIQDYITKVLDKMDTKWLEKNQEFIERNKECKNATVKTKNWKWDVASAADGTKKVEALSEAIDTLTALDITKDGANKLTAAIGDVSKKIGTGGTTIGADSDVSAIKTKMITDAKDAWFEGGHKTGGKSKSVKLASLEIGSMTKVWEGYREERKSYKDMIKDLTTIKNNLGSFKVDDISSSVTGDDLKNQTTRAAGLKKQIGVARSLVDCGITIAKTSYKYSAERRREITSAFKAVISEVKKIDAKEKRNNK